MSIIPFDIPSAIEKVSTLADDIIKRIWPDATEVEKAKLAQLSAEVQNQFNVVLQQLKINEEEAKHPSVWVAGARPAIIWTGVAGFGYTSLIQPLLAWISTAFGIPVPPPIDISALTTVLEGVLGIGAMRSFDKFNSVDTKRLK